MIVPLPGWSWELRASGVLLRGRDGIEIRYAERLHELAPVAELAASAPAPRGWIEGERGPIEPFVTGEGEYAAQLTAMGTVAGAPAVRSFAFVFLDEHIARLCGVAPAGLAATLIATVRELAVGDRHYLGLRRRRYVHAPLDPRTWQGYLRPPYHAHWIPLTHPRDSTRIVVLPAIPLPVDEVTRMLLGRGGGEARLAPLPPRTGTLVATSGLSGSWYVEEQGGGIRDAIALADDRYVYPLVMRSGADERAARLPDFTALAMSIEPIPQPQHRAPAPSASHWTE